MKRDYDHLPLIPSVVAETLCGRPYQQIEYSASSRDLEEIERTEAKRKAMTVQDIEAFVKYADDWCREAFTVKAKWFREIIQAKGNKGRDQLYVWMSHWLAAWLNKPNRTDYHSQARIQRS